MNKEIEIPDGYEAIIEGNKVIIKQKESEDERIRKELLAYIKTHPAAPEGHIEQSVLSSWIAYLENQKEQQSSTPEDIAAAYQMGLAKGRNEQQPAEWSEEQEKMRRMALECLDHISCESKIPVVNWLKSLRPQPHWKPSEEQISALERAIIKMHTPSDIGILAELRDNFKKLQL